MRKIKYFLPVIVALILASCGGGHTKEAKTLKNYNSYAFLPNKDTIKSRSYDNEAIHEEIVSTVNENMKDEDYIVDKNQPDVLIFVHTMFDEKADVNADPIYTSYSYYRPNFYIGPYYEPYVYEDYYTIQRLDGNSIQQVPYTERSIVIDFIDRRSKQIIWRATSDREIGTRRIERDVRNFVEDIFKQFP